MKKAARKSGLFLFVSSTGDEIHQRSCACNRDVNQQMNGNFRFGHGCCWAGGVIKDFHVSSDKQFSPGYWLIMTDNVTIIDKGIKNIPFRRMVFHLRRKFGARLGNIIDMTITIGGFDFHHCSDNRIALNRKVNLLGEQCPTNGEYNRPQIQKDGKDNRSIASRTEGFEIRIHLGHERIVHHKKSCV